MSSTSADGRIRRTFFCAGHNLGRTVIDLHTILRLESKRDLSSGISLGRCLEQVEVDETIIGGYRPGPRGRAALGKTIVMGMLQRGGDVMTKVIPNVQRETLHPIIEENIQPGSTVHTDELISYRGLKAKGYNHIITVPSYASRPNLRMPRG